MDYRIEEQIDYRGRVFHITIYPLSSLFYKGEVPNWFHQDFMASFVNKFYCGQLFVPYVSVWELLNHFSCLKATLRDVSEADKEDFEERLKCHCSLNNYIDTSSFANLSNLPGGERR